jgi:hypothetical protein
MILSCFLAAAFSAGCEIRKPQAPQWFSDWEVPLINRHIEIAEILDRFEDSSIFYDTLGNPKIKITQEIDSVLVDDYLALAGANLIMKDSLGIIEMDPPQDVSATTELSQIVPTDIGFVPPASFDFSQRLPRFEKFDWIQVYEGRLQLTLFNALEVDLDTIVVTIIDSSDYHVIAILPFADGLDYLETETTEVDISGQIISSSLLLRFRGHTPGGVLINIGGQTLEAALLFPSQISVSGARAEIPAISRVKSDYYAIDDSTVVREAEVLNGRIHFGIFNYSELPFLITIRSPNFRLRDNDFEISGYLDPISQQEFDVDLTGYMFMPFGDQSPQSVQVRMENYMPSSAPERFTISASDSIRLQLDVSNIEFRSLSGRISPTLVEIEPVTRRFDLPPGMEQSTLTDGDFYINILNSSGVPAYLDLDISGGGKVLVLSGDVAPQDVPGSPPERTVFTATPEQTREFFSPPPEEIVISGRGILNPYYQTGELSRGDFFIGEVIFESPFALSLADTVEIETEINAVEIDDSRPDDFSESVDYGNFVARLENHLPLGVAVTLFIGARSDSGLFTDPEALRFGPYILATPPIGPGGRVLEPTMNLIEGQIDRSRLDIFENDSVFIGQTAQLLPTDSAGIVLSSSDYLGARAIARFRIKFGD